MTEISYDPRGPQGYISEDVPVKPSSPDIVDALRFYQFEAEALARYMAEGKENKSEAILASVTVLALDAGRRAASALAHAQSSAATARQCPHDMGYDRENGPLGCRLVGQEMECVCEHMHFADVAQPEPDPEVARLRKGIQDFLDGNYENPRQHRPEKCSHGQYWYQGCDQCDEAHFSRLLGETYTVTSTVHLTPADVLERLRPRTGPAAAVSSPLREGDGI